MQEFINGIPLIRHNEIFNLDDKRCYISYNDKDIYHYGCDTTAIVRDDNFNPTKFLILNGNHVKELIKLKTYEECVEYFKKNINLKNKNSENWDEELCFNNGKIEYIKINENNK